MKRTAVCLAIVALSTASTLAQGPGAVSGRGRSTAAPPRPTIPQRPTPQAGGGRIAGRALIARQQEMGGLAGRGIEHRAERFGRPADRPPADRPFSPEIRPDTVPRFTGRERALHEQLAAFDRMRDQAIASGNTSLLQRADELELRAREQFAQFAPRPMHPQSYPPIESTALGVSDPGQLPSAEPMRSTPFGQLVSEQARANGREFGQFTAEQARTLGREFGQSNADKTRLFPPPPSEPAAPPEIPPEEPTAEFTVQP